MDAQRDVEMSAAVPLPDGGAAVGAAAATEAPVVPSLGTSLAVSVQKKDDGPQWEKDGLPREPPATLAIAMSRCLRLGPSSEFDMLFVDLLMEYIWPVGTVLCIASEHRPAPVMNGRRRRRASGFVSTYHFTVLKWFRTYSNTADVIMVTELGTDFCLFQFDPRLHRFVFAGGRQFGNFGEPVMIGFNSIHREDEDPVKAFEKKVQEEAEAQKQRDRREQRDRRAGSKTDETQDQAKDLGDACEQRDATVSAAAAAAAAAHTPGLEVKVVSPTKQVNNMEKFVMIEIMGQSRDGTREKRRYPFCSSLVSAWDEVVKNCRRDFPPSSRLAERLLKDKVDPTIMAQEMRDRFWTDGAARVTIEWNKPDSRSFKGGFEGKFLIVTDAKQIDDIKTRARVDRKLAWKAAHAEAKAMAAKARDVKRAHRALKRQKVAARAAVGFALVAAADALGTPGAGAAGAGAVVGASAGSGSCTNARVDAGVGAGAVDAAATAEGKSHGQKRKHAEAFGEDSDGAASSSDEQMEPALDFDFDYDDGSASFWIDNLDAPGQAYDYNVQNQISVEFGCALDEIIGDDKSSGSLLSQHESKSTNDEMDAAAVAAAAKNWSPELAPRKQRRYHVWVDRVFRRDPCTWCILVALHPIPLESSTSVPHV